GLCAWPRGSASAWCCGCWARACTTARSWRSPAGPRHAGKQAQARARRAPPPPVPPWGGVPAATATLCSVREPDPAVGGPPRTRGAGVPDAREERKPGIGGAFSLSMTRLLRRTEVDRAAGGDRGRHGFETPATDGVERLAIEGARRIRAHHARRAHGAVDR